MKKDNLIKNQNLFPRTTDIPQAHVKDIPCIQIGYLVNGEIQVWDGPRQEVLSPVWVATDNGPKPFSIGEYPLLAEVGFHNAGRGKRQNGLPARAGGGRCCPRCPDRKSVRRNGLRQLLFPCRPVSGQS
jgi:hypothetical protein